MTTPSRYPGVLVEDEGIDFVDDGSVLPPAAPGQMRYHGGKFKFQDATQSFELPSAGSIAILDQVLVARSSAQYIVARSTGNLVYKR